MDIKFHIDTPLDYPKASLFHVSGWLVADEVINAISVGDKDMELIERRDVVEAYPLSNYCVGFHGLARESGIVEQKLVINVDIGGQQNRLEWNLTPNPLFELSQNEKLPKFNQLFPNDDAHQCIVDSQQLEITNDSNIKLDKLKAILVCRECGSVGISFDGGVAKCCNGHAPGLSGKALNYLTNELREQHNIKNNILPASRAQDPLATAIIGKYKDGLILDCGAGLPFQNYANVINFEIEAFSNTDVIGVGEELPFADASFDVVFSFSVLEHVKDPFKCASEIERVLKPGGVIYSSAPFLVPVHGYPHHYYNMTQQGFKNLFGEIEIAASGVPISGHPLFTLSSVSNIWASGLSDVDSNQFKDTTIREIIEQPEKLIEKGFCADLSQDSQALISCTNMILGKKR